MNPRTESTVERREFERGFLPVLCLVTVLALAAIISDQQFLETSKRSTFNPTVYQGFSVLPWAAAGGRTLSNGLDAFSGKQLEYPSSSIRLGVIAGLLLGFVVCPTVYLFGWRERRLRNRSSIRLHALSVSSLIYGGCAIITLSIAAAILPIGLIQENTFASLKEAQNVQTNRDAIVHTIYLITVDLKQYRILPKRVGGGEGSCNGYTLPTELGRTQDGVFSTTVDENGATIVGRSLLSPSSSITVNLSPLYLALVYTGPENLSGVQWKWSFEGDFR